MAGYSFDHPPDLTDSRVRERLSGSAIKAFIKIAGKWGLTETQARGLLWGYRIVYLPCMENGTKKAKTDPGYLVANFACDRHLQGPAYLFWRRIGRSLGHARQPWSAVCWGRSPRVHDSSGAAGDVSGAPDVGFLALGVFDLHLFTIRTDQHGLRSR